MSNKRYKPDAEVGLMIRSKSTYLKNDTRSIQNFDVLSKLNKINYLTGSSSNSAQDLPSLSSNSNQKLKFKMKRMSEQLKLNHWIINKINERLWYDIK